MESGLGGGGVGSASQNRHLLPFRDREASSLTGGHQVLESER